MPDATPTEEQMGYAYVFLNDLKSHKQLAQDWQDHLNKVNDPKYKIEDKVSYLDNFLADNGYNTTAEAVLTLIKTDWWNDYIKSRQPNQQSDRFVQDLLQDPSLYKEWGQTINDCAGSGDLSKADAFLQSNGYDCTTIQVNASFEKMRDQNLNYWTNLYGQTILQKGDEQAVNGPAVIIYGDSTVSVGPDKLFNFKYEDGAITWATDGGGGLLTNPHSGTITFSQINQPKSKDDYVGPIFSGTITYPDGSNPNWSGTYSFYGKAGNPPDNSQGNVYSPPSVDQNAVSKLADTLAPYVMIGFAITMLSGAAAKGVSFGKWIKEKYDNMVKERAKTAKEKTAKENPEVKPDQFSSESTTVRQLKQEAASTPDPVKQNEIEKQIKNNKQTEKEKYDESEKNLTDEGKMKDDLVEVCEI